MIIKKRAEWQAMGKRAFLFLIEITAIRLVNTCWRFFVTLKVREGFMSTGGITSIAIVFLTVFCICCFWKGGADGVFLLFENSIQRGSVL